jgi:hypothetical protein
MQKIADEKQTAGEHQIKFNTENLQGGIYFIKATLAGAEITEKLVVSLDK